MSKKTILLHEYFDKWVDMYKVGAVKQVTLNKYSVTKEELKK